MSSEYVSLVAALTATGIPFAEFMWANAPATGSYGVYALEFDAAAAWADGSLSCRARQGSIDLYCRTGAETDADSVEAVLNQQGVSWRLNYRGFEAARRLVHYEWVFEVYA